MSGADPILGLHERFPYLFVQSPDAAPPLDREVLLSRTLERLLLFTGSVILAHQFHEARDDEEMGARVRQYLSEPSRDRLADLHLAVVSQRPEWLARLLGFPGAGDPRSEPVRDDLMAALTAYRRLLEARDTYGGGSEPPPAEFAGVEERLTEILHENLDVSLRRGPCGRPSGLAVPEGASITLVREGTELPLFPFCMASGESSLLLLGSCGSAGPAYIDAAGGGDVPRSEPEVLTALAEVFLALGQYARAKAVLGELRERGVIAADDPTLLAATYALYGFRCYQKADYEKSAQRLEQSLKLRPDLVRSYYQLCLAYTKKGQPDRAIESLRKLSERFPQQRKTFELLGDLFFEQENFTRALLMYDRALELERGLGVIERKRERVVERIDEGRRSPREALARARTRGSARTVEFLSDMTREAELGLYFPIVGREAELGEVIEVLCCRDKRNALLVGEAGVGKSAMVQELALRIAQGKVPAALVDKRIYLMSVSTLLAGAKFRGQFEERFLDLMKDLREEDCILFIDNIQTLIASGSARGGGLDAAALVKPALVRGEVQVIGTTTYDEYQANIEKDASLSRLFQIVRLEEPDLEATRAILLGARERYEDFHGVRIDREGLSRSLETMRRALRDGAFPDRALDALDRACARVSLEHRAALHDDPEEIPRVGEAEMLAAIASIARVPLPKLMAAADGRLDEIESALKRRVVGQDEAVGAVARVLRTAARGLKLNPRRPNGVLLFIGPTGVGKTELARAMAEYLFGSDEKMIRIDMSEYMERFASTRLIGSPPGYVGYNDTNQLTDRVRQTPSCLLLLDEMEKADLQMFHLFLQVFDAGRLTDARGRTVSFSDVTVVMTSNAGTDLYSREDMGYARTDPSRPVTRAALMREMKRFFAPEFLNRIDEIVFFGSLGPAEMERIARLQLADLTATLAREGKRLVVSDAAVSALAREGYHREFGARHLARVLRRRVLEPLAGASLTDAFRTAAVVRVEAEGDTLHLVLDPAEGVLADDHRSAGPGEERSGAGGRKAER